MQAVFLIEILDNFHTGIKFNGGFFLYSRELCISGFFYKGGIFNQVEILTLGRSDIRSHNCFPGAADATTLLYEGNGE